MSIKQFGRKSLNEIQDVLEKYGATIKKVSFHFSIFEDDILTLFGHKIISDLTFAKKAYLALANHVWFKTDRALTYAFSCGTAELFFSRVTGADCFKDLSNEPPDTDTNNEIIRTLASRQWAKGLFVV